MSAPPKTVLDVSSKEEAAIRDAVRRADVSLLGPHHRIAGYGHVDGLIALLTDPVVSEPIYDLPRPFTPDIVGQWVRDASARQERGEAVLCVMFDGDGDISGYSYFTVWPDRSAAEIAGAHRADTQSRGVGKVGAARSFDWMFEHLGVRLIGLTAAKNNVRSAKLIEAAGFVPKGERSSARPDGSVRQSDYWEMTRDQWRRLRGDAGS
ncbi:MAG: GNAT family protein [Sphingorhabdus sp.]|uniref:GNAT family N-acetyltransferase n=1 Tax=Sphingorhabdus sp. TaxID=1902408 RepID=UPI0032BAE151